MDFQLGLAVIKTMLTRSARSPRGPARKARKRYNYCILNLVLLIVTAGLASGISLPRKQLYGVICAEARSRRGVLGLGSELASTPETTYIMCGEG